MNVSVYATKVVKSRPYKYQTRQTLVKDLKRLGIWDLDVSQVNSSLIRDKVEGVPTQSNHKKLLLWPKLFK